jgi:hypothetical protein
VWGVRDGKLTSHYSRTSVEAAQRQPESEVPRVSDRQWQAIDLLAKLAEELCFEMSFASCDIQFVNNPAALSGKPNCPEVRSSLAL